jgi:hypothetical protein
MRGKWRKLYSERLHNFYSSPNVFRVSTSRRIKGGEVRNAYRISVGKPEGKVSLGSIDLKETEWKKEGLNSSGSG